MIYEYAIEPELAVEWGKDRREYQYFYEQIGIGTPRIMAEFPELKIWRKQFERAAKAADQTNELQRIRIEEIFKLLKERLVRRDSLAYNDALSWLENAELENDRQAFQAILAITNPRHHEKVLSHESIGGSSLWQVDKQIYCTRRSTEIARVVKAMIANCAEIHFIDPHFGPENARHRRPLEAFLMIAATARYCRPNIKNIVVHTSNKASFDFFKQECEDQLQRRIPANIQITLRRWKKNSSGTQLHNRYILTDIGGLKVDPGLDDSNKDDSFELLLLERHIYEKNWNDYVKDPAFELSEPPIQMIGHH